MGEAGSAIDTLPPSKPHCHFCPAGKRKTLYKLKAMARMRATTVRFGTDLWEMLEREAGRSGVSVAQYIRESALARLAYTAGRRGDPDMGFPHAPGEDGDGARPIRARMADLAEAAEAVRHQGNQAVRQAERLLEESMRQTDERSVARERRQRVRGR
jgi:hypothetical protein